MKNVWGKFYGIVRPEFEFVPRLRRGIRISNLNQKYLNFWFGWSARMCGITVEFLGLDSFREKILRDGL